jgi:Schlafen, AlbA_2
MINRRFDLIEQNDIDALVANEVHESRTIEYKEILPGQSDAEKREFLADISAFANASGGDLIYGIKEKRDADGKTTGVAEQITGVSITNHDAEIGRLENILRDGIDPRLPNVQVRHLDGFPQGSVILFRIAKSWAAPHMVIYGGTSRFYSRNNRGKYQLDVGEIRSAFALSQSLPEKIRRFRDDRLGKIVGDDLPVLLPPNAKIIMHMLPIAAFDPATNVDISRVDGMSVKFMPIGVSGWDSRYNLDGFLTFTPEYRSQHNRAYVQLFRNGAIEAISSHTLDMKSIPAGAFEFQLATALGVFLRAEQELGFAPPIFVLVSLLGVKGYKIEGFPSSDPIDRDLLLLPDAIIENYNASPKEVLHHIFDAVWQAAGFPRCLIFDRLQ